MKIWRCAAPLKCKIFVWLLRRRRLPTNARRYRHQLAASAACPSCCSDEDVDHLLVFCHRAQELWSTLLSADQDLNVTAEQLLISSSSSPEDLTIRTAIAWNIWKRRNALVFNSKDEPLQLVVANCVADVRLWAFRCPRPSTADNLKAWCNNFDPP
jgi:hypothetical protein